MANDWDQSYNVGSVTEDQLITQRELTWSAARAAHIDRMERRYGRVDVPELPEAMVRTNFLHHSEAEAFMGSLASWGANRLMWICHNCGGFGFKLGEIRELFKCYCCRSRNVTVCRSGELSMMIRNIATIEMRPGINMEDVFARRQQRQRDSRRTRRENRERAQIEGN